MTIPIEDNAYGLDRGLAAMFCRAKKGETMSHMAALARNANKRWGCVLCWWLGLTVEEDHCDKALAIDGPPTAQPAAIRAGIMLFLLAFLLWLIPFLMLKLAERLV